MGKVRLALEPALNHAWHLPLRQRPEITTSLMPYGG
jgi:hypothetical protein